MKHSTVLAAAMAMGLAFHAQATDYYWIGGESSEWANGSNWSLTEGGEAANAYPSDYSVDEATVTSAATITLPSSNANVSNLYVNANVSLTGGKIHAKTISGSGKLTMLDGTTFYATEYCTTVSVDVEIPQNATVNVSNNGDGRNYGYGVMFTDECALTGAGKIVFDSYRPSNPLYWDARGCERLADAQQHDDPLRKRDARGHVVAGCEQRRRRYGIHNSGGHVQIRFVERHGVYGECKEQQFVRLRKERYYGNRRAERQ